VKLSFPLFPASASVLSLPALQRLFDDQEPEKYVDSDCRPPHGKL